MTVYCYSAGSDEGTSKESAFSKKYPFYLSKNSLPITRSERAAMFNSFFGTCKKNNINPNEWLKKVLDIIPEYKVNKHYEILAQNIEL